MNYPDAYLPAYPHKVDPHRLLPSLAEILPELSAGRTDFYYDGTREFQNLLPYWSLARRGDNLPVGNLVSMVRLGSSLWIGNSLKFDGMRDDHARLRLGLDDSGEFNNASFETPIGNKDFDPKIKAEFQSDGEGGIISTVDVRMVFDRQFYLPIHLRYAGDTRVAQFEATTSYTTEQRKLLFAGELPSSLDIQTVIHHTVFRGERIDNKSIGLPELRFSPSDAVRVDDNAGMFLVKQDGSSSHAHEGTEISGVAFDLKTSRPYGIDFGISTIDSAPSESDERKIPTIGVCGIVVLNDGFGNILTFHNQEYRVRARAQFAQDNPQYILAKAFAVCTSEISRIAYNFKPGRR